jgi:Skp family chaperone for outer membrane proteins
MNPSRSILLVICVLALLVWQVGRTPAQSPEGAVSPAVSSVPDGGGRTAVLDVVRIFDECDQIKDLNALLRDANEAVQNEAASREKQLSQKQIELRAFSPDSPDYAPRRRDFTRMSIDANVWLQTKRIELQRDHYNWTRIVYEECLAAVEEVTRERGVMLVLQKRPFNPEIILDENVENLQQMIRARAVVYSHESLDITDDVIRKMNARYHKRGGRSKLDLGVQKP